jgi:hypothetical protein
MDKGDTWDVISGDLTNDLPQGNVPFSTITEIDESVFQFGMLLIGTDDGKVWLSQSAGVGNWTDISDGLPEGKWVSTVQQSHHRKGRLYVSLNGYRDDDFNTYVFSSDDYGKTWKSLEGNLPRVVVNAIHEDPVNEDLLYLGTDHGTYISTDRGSRWNLLNSIPNVSSYDLIVHPRENELLVATHGRSIYRVDVKPLQKVAEGVDKLRLFETGDVRWSSQWGKARFNYQEPYIPEKVFEYWTDADSSAVLEIYSGEDLVRRLETNSRQGYNTISWDLKKHDYQKRRKKDPVPEPQYIDKGEYKAILKVNGQESAVEFEVK